MLKLQLADVCRARVVYGCGNVSATSLVVVHGEISLDLHCNEQIGTICGHANDDELFFGYERGM